MLLRGVSGAGGLIIIGLRLIGSCISQDFKDDEKSL
jgi:hypothetical protein